MAALRALYAMDEWSALTLASKASISLEDAFYRIREHQISATFFQHCPSDSRGLTKFHSKYPHISLSIWFISFNSNIFCATIHQLWFEYVSSQTILLAIMNAEMNSRCPEEPRADG